MDCHTRFPGKADFDGGKSKSAATTSGRLPREIFYRIRIFYWDCVDSDCDLRSSIHTRIRKNRRDLARCIGSAGGSGTADESMWCGGVFALLIGRAKEKSAVRTALYNDVLEDLFPHFMYFWCGSGTLRLDIVVRLISYYVRVCLEPCFTATISSSTDDTVTEEFIHHVVSLPDKVAPFLQQNDAKLV